MSELIPFRGPDRSPLYPPPMQVPLYRPPPMPSALVPQTPLQAGFLAGIALGFMFITMTGLVTVLWLGVVHHG